jgi:hypothetical protein
VEAIQVINLHPVYIEENVHQHWSNCRSQATLTRKSNFREEFSDDYQKHDSPSNPDKVFLVVIEARVNNNRKKTQAKKQLD